MENNSNKWYNKYWNIVSFFPFIIGVILGGLVLPVLWIHKIIIPEWGLFLGVIPLFIGFFLTNIFRQMEYKDEPSYRCICGYDIYISSKKEHDKECEARQ